jgi:hypothetical protein
MARVVLVVHDDPLNGIVLTTLSLSGSCDPRSVI